TTVAVPAPFDPKKDVTPLNRSTDAEKGFTIAEAKLGKYDEKQLPGLKLTIAANKTSFLLTGQVRPSEGQKKTCPAVSVPVVLTQEKSVEARQSESASGALTVPGSVQLTLPKLPNWANAKREVKLELRDGSKVIWEDGPQSRNRPVLWNGQ